MVIGSIDTFDKGHVVYPEAITKALEYLRDHDFTKMEDGKYLIQGEDCFVNLQRYVTKLPEDCHPETHKKYVDIQYLAAGEEYVGWCPFSPDLEVLEPYDEEKDIAFYKCLVPESDILLKPGCFAVLYPDDVHAPQCAVDKPMEVVKAVVKVSVDLL
jgi:YhcH/YjgK/YiaL family protein